MLYSILPRGFSLLVCITLICLIVYQLTIQFHLLSVFKFMLSNWLVDVDIHRGYEFYHGLSTPDSKSESEPDPEARAPLRGPCPRPPFTHLPTTILPTQQRETD